MTVIKIMRMTARMKTKMTLRRIQTITARESGFKLIQKNYEERQR